MNEERPGSAYKWQVDHIRSLLWHRYSVTVNQVMVATVKLSKWLLQLNQKEHLMQKPSIKEILIGTTSSEI